VYQLQLLLPYLSRILKLMMICKYTVSLMFPAN
jgi:hypothetical protein